MTFVLFSALLAFLCSLVLCDHGYLNRDSDQWGVPTDVCIEHYHSSKDVHFSSILKCNTDGSITTYYYRSETCQGKLSHTDVFRSSFVCFIKNSIYFTI